MSPKQAAIDLNFVASLALHIMDVHGVISLALFTSIQCSTSPGQTLVTCDEKKTLHIMVFQWSSLWTMRQRAYSQSLELDSFYTPKVVVQGRSWCLGSDTESDLSLIRSAPRFPFFEIKTAIDRSSELSEPEKAIETQSIRL